MSGRRNSARASVAIPNSNRGSNRGSLGSVGRRGSTIYHARNSMMHYDLLPALDEDAFANVKIKIAGMPRYWKVVNVVFVVFPRILFWILMLDSGHIFLMETAPIEDTIINAVSLFFILSIDELIYTTVF